MDYFSVEELIAHCNRQKARLSYNSVLWKEHESILHYLRELQSWRRESTAQLNEPLSLEELRGMDGKPVFIKCLFNEDLSSYAVIDKAGNGIFTRLSYASFEFYGDEWLAYRRKPEASTP